MSRSRAAPELEDARDPIGAAWSLELERAILSVVLDGRHADAWATVCEHCAGAQAFHHRDHRLLCLVIEALALAGQPINGQSVATAAGQVRFAKAMEALHGKDAKALIEMAEVAHGDSVLAAVGGFNAVADLAGSYGPVTGLASNARHLDAYHRQRRAIEVLGDLYARIRAVDGAQAVRAIADEAVNRLCDVAAPGRAMESIGAGGEASAALHDEAYRAGGEVAATWGIGPLDEACRLTRRRLVVVAARPGCGKTSLALQAACATRDAMGGEAVAMVSLEMGTDELSRIIIGRQLKVSRRNIERGWLSSEQRRALDEAVAGWKANDIRVKGHGGNGTIDEIVAWIRTLHRRTGGRLHLVTIDYLGLINGTDKRQTTNDRIGEITRKLKLLALDLGLCVMLLCQMNRLSAKEKRPPELSDLRDSGNIEQDADGVVLLWSNDPEDRDSILVNAKVAKNRLGSLRTIGVDFHKANGQRFDAIGSDNAVPRGTRMYGEPDPAEDVLGQPATPQQEP